MGGYYCDLCTTLEKPDRTSLSLSEFKFSVQISRQTDDLGLEKVGIYICTFIYERQKSSFLSADDMFTFFSCHGGLKSWVLRKKSQNYAHWFMKKVPIKN